MMMGLVKTRRLAAMQKQQRYPPSVASAVGGSMRGAKAGIRPPKPKDNLKSEIRRRKP